MLWADDNLLSTKNCDGTDRESSFRFADLLETSNSIIPGFRIVPGILSLYNFSELSQVVIFKPYTSTAKFTTETLVGWLGSTLTLEASLDMYYDESFQTGGPRGTTKRTISFLRPLEAWKLTFVFFHMVVSDIS